MLDDPPPSRPRELELRPSARSIGDLERLARWRHLRCPACGESLVIDLEGGDVWHFAAACVWCDWPAPGPRREPRAGWASWEAAYWEPPTP